MWISISKGTVFAYAFLAIIAVSHAFVFWIPVWKSSSALRYNPRRGWHHISRSRGSGLGLFKTKPVGFYPYEGGSPFHKFNSQRFKFPHHSQSIHHRPLPSIFNLNHHHPLCPLCHVHNYLKKKPSRKPQHSFHPGASSGHNSFHSPRNNRFFSPPNIFKLNAPIFADHHEHHRSKYSSQFNFPSKFSHSNNAPFSFPSKFNGPFPKMNQFKEFQRNPYFSSTHANHNNNYKYIKSNKYQNYNHQQHYPKGHSPYRHQYKNNNNYRNNYSYSPISYNYSSNINEYKKHKKLNHSKTKSYYNEPEMLPPSGDEMSHYPTAIKSSIDSAHQQFSKEFSNYAFEGFGSGAKGNGWAGWDW